MDVWGDASSLFYLPVLQGLNSAANTATLQHNDIKLDLLTIADSKLNAPYAEVVLGDGASDYVALSAKVDSELNKIKDSLAELKTLLAAHTHPGVMPGPSTTSPAADFTSYAPPNLQSTAAEKVKAI